MDVSTEEASSSPMVTEHPPMMMPVEIERINELWRLLQQKDEDLRRAAEFGKMLLDEKEADAEAHEGEKEALWRRIQDMARRVVELEQELAEMRSFANTDTNYFRDPSPCPETPRVGERVLRAKNEMLERQLAHLKDQEEETQLELAAAKKARFFRLSSCRSRAPGTPAGRRDPSFDGAGNLDTVSPAAASLSSVCLSTGKTPVNADNHRPTPRSAGGPMRLSTASRGSSWARLMETPRVSDTGPDGEGAGHGYDGDGVDSEASEEALRNADRIHASSWSAGAEEDEQEDEDGEETEDGIVVNAYDAAWLVEQNAWLIEEMESKDELIEALRQQVEQQHQQLEGSQRRPSSPSHQALRELAEGTGSDDDANGQDGNETPTFGTRERSFMDDLLDETVYMAAASPVFLPSEETPCGDGFGLGEIGDAAAKVEGTPDVPDGRRSFGGVLMENVLQPGTGFSEGTENTLGNATGKRAQSKSPAREDCENSPIQAPRNSVSPLRRRSADQWKGPSPVVAARKEAGGVTGVVGQHTANTAHETVNKAVPEPTVVDATAAMGEVAPLVDSPTSVTNDDQPTLDKEALPPVVATDCSTPANDDDQPTLEEEALPPLVATGFSTPATDGDQPTLEEEVMPPVVATDSSTPATDGDQSTFEEEALPPLVATGSSMPATDDDQPTLAGEALLPLVATDSSTPATDDDQSTLEEEALPALMATDSSTPATDDDKPTLEGEALLPLVATGSFTPATDGDQSTLEEEVLPALVAMDYSTSSTDDDQSTLEEEALPALVATDSSTPATDDDQPTLEEEAPPALVAMDSSTPATDDHQPTLEGEEFLLLVATDYSTPATDGDQCTLEEDALPALVATDSSTPATDDDQLILEGEALPPVVATELPTPATDDDQPTFEEALPPVVAAAASVPEVVSVRAAKRAAIQEAKVEMEAKEAAAAAVVAAVGPPPATTYSRAERKSRQAMGKLGLRTVKGVFRMTMKTSNGVVFVVKNPDVFKHPQQNTYVVFGTSETDCSGNEVYAPNPPQKTMAASPVRLSSVEGVKCMSKVAMKTGSRPDAEAVEIESVSAGLDPADVLTIISHVGCTSEAAISALRQADGDVVNAVMHLTEG